MYYAYVICPKCKDKLIAVENMEDLEPRNQRDKRHCPICNNQYVLALIGEQEIDNTIYTITFVYRDRGYSTKKLREKLNGELFNIEEIIPESDHEIMDSVVYKGDVLHALLLMDALTDSAISYTITPEFPFERFIYIDMALCEKCGSPTVEKTVPGNPQYSGFYCEKCKEWIMRTDWAL